MSKDQTKEYEVVRKNTLDFEVGEIVDLTDSQAKSLVNKVKLYVKPKAKADPKPQAKAS